MDSLVNKRIIMRYWQISGRFSISSIVNIVCFLIVIIGLYSCDTIRQIQVLGNLPMAIETEAIAFKESSIVIVLSFNGTQTIDYNRVQEAIIYFHNNLLVRYEVDGADSWENNLYTVQDDVTIKLFFKLDISSGDTLVIDPSKYLNLPSPLPLTLIIEN